jgi:hypothetical protein
MIFDPNYLEEETHRGVFLAPSCGFAGLYAALELERLVGAVTGIEITLVLRSAQLFAGEVEDIDIQGSQLTLSH